MITIISLGAGVQSTTVAYKAALGEWGPVHGAIFADTGAEPTRVYEHLADLERRLPFPVYRVMWKDGLLKNIERAVADECFAGAPFFTQGETREGRLRRQCTREFKVQPIVRKLRELVGLEKGQRVPRGTILVRSLIGISFDEFHRMKPSREPWIRHEFPLVDHSMTRRDCLEWLSAHGYPLPGKSSCTFCPYHDDGLWRDMKLNDPKAWEQAVNLDRLIRTGVRGKKQPIYVHRSCRPLEEVDLRNPADFGQQDLFGEECEGLCGV